jgi:hypothetical protein
VAIVKLSLCMRKLPIDPPLLRTIFHIPCDARHQKCDVHHINGVSAANESRALAYGCYEDDLGEND